MVPNKFISMRKLAKLAGVSPATASRVFSSPGTVAADTVQRVSSLAEEIGFMPNQIAKAAFGKATKSVGVLLYGLGDPNAGELGDGILSVLMPRGYLPIILPQYLSAENVIGRLLQHQVDALIFGLSDEQIDISAICRKQMARVPIVAVETPRPGLWCDTVLNDDYTGGKLAADHLLAMGHRAFGFIQYGGAKSNCIPRRKGFEDTLLNAGCHLDERCVVYMGFDNNYQQRLQTDLCRILQSPNRPTAFFAPSDYMAMQLYQAAEQSGLRIPDDISVIGFGDYPYSTLIQPKLTSIRQNHTLMGQRAAEFVLRRIASPDIEPETITIPVTLIERDSVKKYSSIRNASS